MNKAILVGRLTADPELKSTPNGVNVCSFSVAVDRRFVRAGEERKADFINCVAWRQTAEFISRFFSKGRMIGLVGSIQTRTYNDREGNKRYATEVVVDEAYFTESKGSSAPQTERTNTWTDAPAAEPTNTFGTASDFDQSDFMPSMSDDDLPF